MHLEGPVTVSLRHCLQYKQYHKKNYVMSTIHGDNCFEIGGQIGIVRNILKDNDNSYILFGDFSVKLSFFQDPIDSASLSVYVVEPSNAPIKQIALSDIKTKYVILPYKNKFVVMPQLHFQNYMLTVKSKLVCIFIFKAILHNSSSLNTFKQFKHHVYKVKVVKLSNLYNNCVNLNDKVFNCLFF